MLLILIISATLFVITMIVALINGWFSLLALWVSCVTILVALGGLAVTIVKPRFPDWWAQHIATESISDYSPR